MKKYEVDLPRRSRRDRRNRREQVIFQWLLAGKGYHNQWKFPEWLRYYKVIELGFVQQ